MRPTPTSELYGTERHRQRVEYTTGIAALEAIAGRDAALAIINACAGREILVRAIPLLDDELSELVGLEAAQAIADELLGDDEGEGRKIFINHPVVLVRTPGETVTPLFDAVVSPREVALKGSLNAIEETCGHDAALKLVAHYGGRRLYVPNPENLTDDSTLSRVLGLDAARVFCDAFQGARIDMPASVYGSSAVRRDTGMRMLRDGYTPADVTRLLKVSRSVVFEWSRKIKEEQK